MGRITIFTSDDLNSAVVRRAFEARNIPYSEISLIEHPQRRSDLLVLTGGVAVPAVFFNTRLVTGPNIIRELRSQWDASKRYSTPMEKYNAEIAKMGDPSNTKLALPTSSSSSSTTPKQSVLPKRVDFELMDGTKTTYFDIVERLRNSLPMQDVQIKGTLHKKVFSGEQAIEVFQSAMGLSASDALQFGNRLLSQNIMHSIGDTKKKTLSSSSASMVVGNNSSEVYYRLQCYKNPNILNSYRDWDQKTSKSNEDPLKLVSDLTAIMTEIRASSLDHAGMLDHSTCIAHSLYPQFEEEVCELQTVKVGNLSEPEKLAFSINVYRLMLSYAFIKVGIPLTEADRIHFLANVKFIIGHCVFTLKDWIDGVLRCNQKSVGERKAPFPEKDPRRKFALQSFDRRIHFAINVGSIVASNVSPPFSVFSAKGIDSELNTAARVFFEGKQNIIVEDRFNEVQLPKVLGWYRSDFAKETADFLESLRNHMGGLLSMTVEKSLFSKNGKVKLTFMDTNWGQTSCNFKRYEKKINNDADVKVKEGIIKGVLRRFLPPKTPDDEDIRVGTLHKLQILDTLPDERLDRITRAVQIEFGVPICVVSLVDTNRQWFKSNQWICPAVGKPSETGRDISFCGHAILQNDIMVINDALLDDRFADNPLVTGDLKLRFYAGVPLSMPNIYDGSAGATKCNIGTLCIIDHRPRELSDQEIQYLRHAARQIEDAIQREDTSQSTADTDFI